MASLQGFVTLSVIILDIPASRVRYSLDVALVLHIIVIILTI